MPTYHNPGTDVVHWVTYYAPRFETTACHCLDKLKPSWNSKNFDPVGSPADVTCCHCRGTAAWLEAAQKESELVRKYDALLREEPTR